MIYPHAAYPRRFDVLNGVNWQNPKLACIHLSVPPSAIPTPTFILPSFLPFIHPTIPPSLHSFINPPIHKYVAHTYKHTHIMWYTCIHPKTPTVTHTHQTTTPHSHLHPPPPPPTHLYINPASTIPGTWCPLSPVTKDPQCNLPSVYSDITLWSNAHTPPGAAPPGAGGVLQVQADALSTGVHVLLCLLLKPAPRDPVGKPSTHTVSGTWTLADCCRARRW